MASIPVPTQRPRPITAQIVTALARLREARDRGDVDQEWACQSALDYLLDRYLLGQR